MLIRAANSGMGHHACKVHVNLNRLYLGHDFLADFGYCRPIAESMTTQQTFNIKRVELPKFLLVLVVYLFACSEEGEGYRLAILGSLAEDFETRRAAVMVVAANERYKTCGRAHNVSKNPLTNLRG